MGGDKEQLQRLLDTLAPTKFAEPGPIRRKKDLIVEGESFRWK